MATDDKPPEGKRSASAKGRVVLMLAWSAVGIPLLWGVVQTVEKALPLFR